MYIEDIQELIMYLFFLFFFVIMGMILMLQI